MSEPASPAEREAYERGWADGHAAGVADAEAEHEEDAAVTLAPHVEKPTIY